MLPKPKKDKIIKPKSKNIIIPLNSKLTSKIHNNKSENKLNSKRIKNNSIPHFIDKNKTQKKNIKNKVKIRNINQKNERERNTISNINKIASRLNTTKNKEDLYNFCKLSNLLKNENLKKTIIIDDKGNNNLNLIMNDKTNQKEKNKINKVEEEMNDDNIKSEFNSLFMEGSYQSNIILNNDNNKYQNMRNNNNITNTLNNMNTNDITKKNEEKSQVKNDKRIDEYSHLFKLLDENIEQFKNILNKKEPKFENKENKKNKKNSNIINLDSNFLTENNKKKDNIKRIKSNDIMSQKVLLNINQKNNMGILKKQNNMNKHKKNFLEENLNNNNLNLSKDKNNSNLFSFLDSFTQEDIFQPLNNKHKKNSSKILTNIFNVECKEDNKIMNKKEIDRISSNEMSTNNKCYEDEEIQMEVYGTEEHIKCDKVNNRDINPHFFSNDFVNNNKKKNVNLDKDCLIF